MKNVLRILIVVFSLLLALSPLSAQDTAEDAPACDLDTVNNVIDVYTDALAKLKASGETDPVKLVNELEDLALGAARLRATCDGLAFTGSSQKVIGPVEFPEGTYRVTARTGGAMIALVTVAEGECGQGQYMSANLFLLMSTGKEGSETLFVSKGCTALIEVSNVQGDWAMDFENLTTGK